MALSNPLNVFGIHSFTPYSRTDGTPYGTLRVLGSANLELTAEQEDLFGGSQRYAWASEPKTVSTQLTLNTKQYEDFEWQLFLGASYTQNSAETSGNVTALANVKGTSVLQASTGIASVQVIPSTGAANLKFGRYVVKVTDVASDTVTIYAASDIDFLTGTDAAFTDDTLAVATAIIPGGSATVDVAALGIQFTGGSGTVAMTLGDTAEFYVRPINTGNWVIDVGASGATFPEFGAVFLAAKRSNFEMFEIEAYRCQGAGMPLGLNEQAWSTADITVKCLYDSVKNKVFRVRHVQASA